MTGSYDPADLEILDSAELTRVDQFESANAAAEYISCRATVRRISASRIHVPVSEISLGRSPCPVDAEAVRDIRVEEVSGAALTPRERCAVLPEPAGLADASRNVTVQPL